VKRGAVTDRHVVADRERDSAERELGIVGDVQQRTVLDVGT